MIKLKNCEKARKRIFQHISKVRAKFEIFLDKYSSKILAKIMNSREKLLKSNEILDQTWRKNYKMFYASKHSNIIFDSSK